VLERLAPRTSCMYRPQRNAMRDVMILRAAAGSRDQIPRDNVRLLLRTCATNYTVVYLPDQTYLGSRASCLTVFGEPAVTNTAAASSRRSAAPPCCRNSSGGCRTAAYPRRHWSSAAGVADRRCQCKIRHGLSRRARELHSLAPEQYLWLYKKFKGPARGRTPMSTRRVAG